MTTKVSRAVVTSEEALRAIALGIIYGITDGEITSRIPQSIWDALFEDKLITVVTDQTGDGWTVTTKEGNDALRYFIDSLLPGDSHDGV